VVGVTEEQGRRVKGEANRREERRVTVTVSVCAVAMSASEILRELDSLKDAKAKIEHKISALEAQLREINLRNDAAPLNGSSPLYPTNGLTQDMIHRYSRHLMLPSFGVQGLLFNIIYALLSFYISLTKFKLRNKEDSSSLRVYALVLNIV